MSIVPITAVTPACFGICCPEHAQCARYHAVETTLADHTIASCTAGTEKRPMFVAMDVGQEQEGKKP